MKHRLFGVVLLLHGFLCQAQTPVDTLKTLDAVTVTGVKRDVLRQTPFNIAVLPAQALQSSVNFSVSDALRQVPGLSQITTGPGISKPVIRGLYGNRIQTVLLGLRFDNQQWQDEHGLGLSIIGIDRIEVLKGPSSLLYGTEAMGGVIRIVEEKPAAPGTKEGDVMLQTFSNTYGLSVNAGLKAATEKTYWRVRVGADSHADYSDGAGNRVLNSRFASYNGKATLGFTKNRWASENNFYTSYSTFGFIMDDNRDRKPLDGRWSRRLDGPKHAVFFNILSSENTVQLSRSRLQLNGGVHSNLRLENEGGNRVSLNMLLNTITYNVKWYKPLSLHTEFIAGQETQFQTNRNYGARVIVPDANLAEGSLSAYVKKTHTNVQVETGVSVSGRAVKTFKTENMDYSSRAIFPFSKTYVSANGNAGVAYNPTARWNLKFNASTGYRSPNLAELSSNGLHEGTFRFEIGNQAMKAEQNVNTEINVNYESNVLSVYTAAYVNLFRNYIYLAPTGTELYGFEIYRFLQGDARLYGGEASVRIQPVKRVALLSQFATVTGRLKGDGYLPFVPADKWTTDLTFSNPHIARHADATWRGGVVYVFAQNHPGAFETRTSPYALVNASVQVVAHRRQRDLRFSLAGENLLNRRYYDHLSRFKYFGIYNPGRNVALAVSIPISKQQSNIRS